MKTTRTIQRVENELSNAKMAKIRYQQEYGFASPERQTRLASAVQAKIEEIFNLEAELCDLKGLE